MSPANENHSIEERHLATMLAARAMLAELLEYRRCGLRNDTADAAIAQAEAAGIEAPARVIAASSDLAKGDAP